MLPSVEELPVAKSARRDPFLLEGNVLLVSGDPGFLEYYREIFLGLGLRPSTMSTYHRALARLKTECFDFIVVDQGSRSFEGRCILERAIELDERGRVLVVTRQLDLPCYVTAMRLGAIGYVEDPVAVPEIVRIITTSLRPAGPRVQPTTRKVGPLLHNNRQGPM